MVIICQRWRPLLVAAFVMSQVGSSDAETPRPWSPSDTPAQREEEVKGVNPADLDTRFDVIGKYTLLPGGSRLFTTTLKYDYKVNGNIGVNFEMPVLGNFQGFGANQWGNGDLFARARYVQQFGRWSLGGAVETVLPVASQSFFGEDRFQLNFGLLAVYTWSPAYITAVAVKAHQSVGGIGGGPAIQYNYFRAIQAFIFPNRTFITLDARYNWETINTQDKWYEASIEYGLMIDPLTSASVQYSRVFGDIWNRGAVQLAVKRFF